MNIVWNGESTNEFHPLRGIREGDLLSLNLFFICMERLSHLINHKAQAGTWKPIVSLGVVLRLLICASLMTCLSLWKHQCHRWIILNFV